jgi:NodT family efflux transporter outer membrane factor (OMF) lipoprotein
VRRSIEAADAELGARVEDARDVAVTVAAETARAYVELRAFQARLGVARRNVALQEQTLGLAQTRFEAGLAGERDVAQAGANLETTRARVPGLQVGVRAAENRLAVLVGLAPGALAEELGPAPVAASGAAPGEARSIPVPPAVVAVGAPADLLRRRSDVRRAERVLAAETARIGVTQAELYPRLTLGGSLGVASESTGDLLESRSSVFDIGPSLRWNLFDGGRLRRLVEAQDARAGQALVRWERTVLLALEEAENAMTAFVREQSRRQSLALASTQARRAVDLAQTQYRAGLADFQAVVDTERTVAALEDDLAQSEAAIATNAIALYKALGGGWEQVDVLAGAGGT